MTVPLDDLENESLFKPSWWIFMCQNVNIIAYIWSPNLVMCVVAKIGGCTRLLIVKAPKVSKVWDWVLKCSYHFEIWQAHRQQCCRGACQISERSYNSIWISRLPAFPRSCNNTSYPCHRILIKGPWRSTAGCLAQCMIWPVAHSPNSTWFQVELLGNCCEPLKILMKC